ncbi:hypothetical protein J3E68DRAFT_420557 [Trichoderma sp. SZMC 28012]
MLAASGALEMMCCPLLRATWWHHENRHDRCSQASTVCCWSSGRAQRTPTFSLLPLPSAITTDTEKCRAATVISMCLVRGKGQETLNVAAAANAAPLQ